MYVSAYHYYFQVDLRALRNWFYRHFYLVRPHEDIRGWWNIWGKQLLVPRRLCRPRQLRNWGRYPSLFLSFHVTQVRCCVTLVWSCTHAKASFCGRSANTHSQTAAIWSSLAICIRPSFPAWNADANWPLYLHKCGLCADRLGPPVPSLSLRPQVVVSNTYLPPSRESRVQAPDRILHV